MVVLVLVVLVLLVLVLVSGVHYPRVRWRPNGRPCPSAPVG
jgi:hypothetical protein